MVEVTDSTPVAMLTAGQLKAFLNESAQQVQPAGDDEQAKQGRLVYGLAGIQSLFNVSHVTAQRYKDGILAEACSQQGRKIIVDVDKAIELFKNSRNAHSKIV